MILKSLALFLLSVTSSLADLNLLLLHNNDMHGRFEETSQLSGTCKPQNRNVYCYGGFARVAHVVREARKDADEGKGPKVLFLNAGDTYTGTSWFSVHKWKIAVDFINRLQPDAISFGNHEFDYGVEGVVPFIENLKVPLVGANFDFSEEPLIKSPIKKSVILEIGGQKIGIIGYLLPDTAIIANVGRVKILDEVASIKSESEKLHREGVKIIFAVGHSGFEMDKKIASQVPLVDVVVGGHTNTFLWNGKQPDVEVPAGPYPFVITQKSGKKVPVVQAYAYTKYLGRLNLTFNDAGDLIRFEGQPLLLNAKIPQDEDILKALEEYRPALENRLKETLGNAKVDLNMAKCRLSECNFGNLAADAFVEYVALNYAGKYWTEAPIAVINGGSIRSSVDPGSITFGDLLGSFPFDIQISTFSLNGSDVLKMLETGVRSNGETSRGEFLQVSGMQVKYNWKNPVGNRVVDVMMRCGQCGTPIYEPLDINRTYRLIANNFILNGGDAYTVLKEKSFDVKEEDMNDVDIIAWYIKRKMVVFPEEQRRITFAKEGNNTSSSERVNLSVTTLLTFLIISILYPKMVS